jgi:diguanylate cyclase (GGDEF)-like protein/PAS domain S-box-containing protein
MIRTATLLVVDDNEATRDTLSRRLAQRGYGVSVAARGEDALDAVAHGGYDLVVLGVELPDMSGFEVLAHIRRAHAPHDLPIIMITARTEGPDVVEALRLGANDFVARPIDVPVALARIATHLSHRHALADLEESHERFALAVAGANDGMWDWNLLTNAVYWSPRWKALIGHGDTEIGTSPEEWLSRVHGDDEARVRDGLAAHLAGGGPHYASEHRILHKDGTFRWVLCRGAAIRRADGTATRLAGSLTDITDARVSDALTGLPNHVLFLDLLDRAIKRADRRHDYRFALLVLALDRFGMVGDSLGAVASDRLIVATADRLRSCLRSTDAVTPEKTGFTLARLAGDEFTILIDDIGDARDAVRVAERLQGAVERAFEIDGHRLFMSATVGIAVSTTGYRAPAEMLRDATTALHRAQGNATACELFDPAMRDRVVANLRLENDLRNSVGQQGFLVHYQPILSVATGRIDGFEALVRWRHPSRGLVLPDEFIGVAESTGLIEQIGRYVLAESCGQLAAWQRRFGANAPRAVSVNVSTLQFAGADLAGEVEAVLRATGLPAASLKLEITESALMGDICAAQRTLQRLRAIGVEWSIDDFGTGYSSLSHLHQLRVNTLKIDRSFVSRIGADDNGAQIVSAIVGLAHSLSMNVVAEGVESEPQFRHLRALGCEFVQGFRFSRPVAVDAAERLIAAQPWTLGEVADMVSW